MTEVDHTYLSGVNPNYGLTNGYTYGCIHHRWLLPMISSPPEKPPLSYR